MPNTFDELWNYIVKRSDDMAFPVVQERSELEHVFNLIRGCESYLEIGTAEGNSLYVLSHALHDDACIRYIDFGEDHTKSKREKAIVDSNKDIFGALGNSHGKDVIIKAIIDWSEFEVVLIDAGHSYEDVIADATVYGAFATKYIIFHDIMLDGVAKAFDWYCRQRPDCEWYKFVNSETYGYGIMKVKNV